MKNRLQNFLISLNLVIYRNGGEKVFNRSEEILITEPGLIRRKINKIFLIDIGERMPVVNIHNRLSEKG